MRPRAVRHVTEGPLRAEGEGGFTLVELLVASMLLLVVIGITGTLLIRTLTTQNEVRELAAASNEAQVTVSLMERSLRNAASVSIPGAFSGDLLVVKTRLAEDGADPDSWVCRAWYYDEPAERIYLLTAPATGTPPTQSLAQPLDLAGWQPVMEGVLRASAGAGPVPVFAPAGPQGGATVTFDARGGSDGRRVTITSSAIPRPQGAVIGGAACD